MTTNIPDTLKIALERTGLPVKPRYTGDEVMDLLAATSDMVPPSTGVQNGKFAVTQKDVAEIMGLKIQTAQSIEYNAIVKLRRSGVFCGIL